MAEKQIYTFVSSGALKGIQRLAKDREVHVMASPKSGEYTVVTIRNEKTGRLGARKKPTHAAA